MTLQLIVLFIVLVIISSYIKKAIFRLLTISLLSLLLLLEISALYLTNRFVDHRFIQHLNLQSFNEFGFQFSTEIALFFLVWILSVLLINFLALKLQQKQISHIFSAIGMIAGLALMLLPQGIIKPIWESYQISKAKSQSFNQALQDIGINPNQYIKPSQVQAEAGKNIIVISLESLEQGFLSPPFNDLTPHLIQLTEQWTYFNQMPSSPGSDWTAGSLFTQQTGMPALFNQQHFDNNNLFQSTEQLNLTTLSHVLKAAGYNSKYLIGKPEFAGMDSILNTIGMDIISEQNSLGRHPITQAGLHDHDLFREAKLQIDQLIQQQQPFALFLSTVNTHFPYGIMDRRMEQFVKPREDQLEFLISATDYLVYDFINHLSAKGLMENTIVYIFPDHLMMGNTGTVVNTLKQHPRQLYLISSADPEQFNKPTSELIYQADLPRMILDGAGIKSNARFLTDLIKHDDFNAFINDNKTKLSAVNNAAIARNQFQNGLSVDTKDHQLVVSSDEHQLILKPEFIKPTEIYQVTFSKTMVPLEHQQIPLNEALIHDHIDPELKHLYLQIFANNGKVNKVILGNRLGDELVKNNLPVDFTQAEISALMSTNVARPIPEDKTKTILPLRQFAEDRHRFIAHAGGAIDGHKYTNSLQALNHNYKLGFKLFELDIIETEDGHFVAAHDWQQWQQQTQFQGTLPPTLKAFNQHQILNQYTALDMAGINEWFEQHQDAILVTDKINKPVQFAEQFIDSSRLKMELFTWPAVRKALRLNLNGVMPTADLLFKTPGNALAYLKKLNIQELAVSRRWAESQLPMIKKLVNADIKLYAFHIGFDPGKDQDYVVCRERRFFYGLYADSWNFDQLPECN